MTVIDGRKFLLRVDAGQGIGTGHLMRCLALAQAWKARGEQAMFITVCECDALRQRLLDEGFEVVALKRSYPDFDDWEGTSRVLASHPGVWVVLDGYHFDAAYQLRIKEAGHSLLVIDDMAHLDDYHADIVLNQNIHAERLQYSSEPHTRLLLGTRYVLLRSEFSAWREWRREIPEVARKVLVTLGGGDPDNITLKVIQALQNVDVDGLEAVVVVGARNPHYEELRYVIQHSHLAGRIERNVQNMPALMAWADVAISAGGSTCWELAFMGLPMVTVVLAENQTPIAESLEAAGAALTSGWHTQVSSGFLAEMLTGLLLNPKARRRMSKRGKSIVDGRGAKRIVELLMSVQTQDQRSV
jgi:UDP-2,4-diacetamido-2,4,6-trideoxy-beta-L-altropyranose hydrolase